MLAIYPRFNTMGRADASGAFIPGAREFLQTHRIPVNAESTLIFDNTMKLPLRKAFITRALRVPRPKLRTVAIFCHGWKDGLQCGFRSGDVADFADVLSRVCEGNCEKVLLYACDNGRDADSDELDDLKDDVGGDGGFADLLRDEFRRRGDPVTIWAHAKEGHSFQNPFMREFKAEEAIGGRFVIEPKSPLWPRWRRALRGSDLWARFPFMTRQALYDELEDGRV